MARDRSKSLGRRVQLFVLSIIRSLFSCHRTPAIYSTLTNKLGTRSSADLSPTGFEYTDNSSSATVVRHLSISDEHENPSQHRDTTVDMVNPLNTLFEVNSLQEVRTRTFSHWPYRTSISSERMIEAGFFYCNSGDRVICICCNLICQVWTPYTDDPCEVHKTLSPGCIYVKSKLTRRELPSIINANETSMEGATSNHSPTANTFDPLQSNEIVYTAACNPAYIGITERSASFTTWPRENLASINDLVRSGFFYTGTKTIITCFYCNGSFQNWGPNDNSMTAHALWLPHCAYAKQWCGDDLYRKLQEAQRARSGVPSDANIIANIGQLQIPDGSTLSRLVNARLDLPISQNILNQKYDLSVVTQCWKDQLILKQDDFVSDLDLRIACIILQKQIEHIDGNNKNIIIPGVKMRQIREQAEKEEKEALTQRQAASVLALRSATQSKSTNAPDNTGVDITTSKENHEDLKPINPTIAITNDHDQSDNSVPSNLCILCLTEEKQLAYIPCGHLAACVPCGYSLRSCPICRREIKAFVRIYN